MSPPAGRLGYDLKKLLRSRKFFCFFFCSCSHRADEPQRQRRGTSRPRDRSLLLLQEEKTNKTSRRKNALPIPEG